MKNLPLSYTQVLSPSSAVLSPAVLSPSSAVLSPAVLSPSSAVLSPVKSTSCCQFTWKYNSYCYFRILYIVYKIKLFQCYLNGSLFPYYFQTLYIKNKYFMQYYLKGCYFHVYKNWKEIRNFNSKCGMFIPVCVFVR